jgi:hypothetical protein
MGELIQFPGEKVQKDVALIESRLAEVKVLNLEEELHAAQEQTRKELERIGAEVRRQWTPTPAQLTAQEEYDRKMREVQQEKDDVKYLHHEYSMEGNTDWEDLEAAAAVVYEGTAYQSNFDYDIPADCTARKQALRVLRYFHETHEGMPPVLFVPEDTLMANVDCPDVTPRWID